nr:PqqD family protein [uncultured Carboxylicivirga sp.]
MDQLQYKKVSGFVEKKLGNELVIVPVASEVAQMNKVFAINEVGLYILEQLNESKSEKEIIDLVCKEFDVNTTVAKNDIKDFLSEAISANIIKATNK